MSDEERIRAEADRAWLLERQARDEINRLRASLAAARGALERIRDNRVQQAHAVEAESGTFCFECERYVGPGLKHGESDVCGIAERTLAGTPPLQPGTAPTGMKLGQRCTRPNEHDGNHRWSERAQRIWDTGHLTNNMRRSGAVGRCPYVEPAHTTGVPPTCGTCHGNGSTWVGEGVPNPRKYSWWKRCADCKGTGRATHPEAKGTGMEPGQVTCPDCRGTQGGRP